MRHLDRTLVASVLKRGRSVENFVGRVPGTTVPSIRYIELRPVQDSVEVWVHDRDDSGGLEFTDLVEFAPLDPERDEQPNAAFVDIEAAIAYAESTFGAARDRWTNVTVCHDDYADFVRAGRPPTWPAA
jgi:hypothetical protein